MKISRILGENFFRKDLNLKNRWWHRSLSILFVLSFFYFILSSIVAYSNSDMFVGGDVQKWKKVESLSERITSELKTPGSLLREGEKLGEDDRSYVLNDSPNEIYNWVSNDVYCSTKIQNHIEEIKNERKIGHLLIRDLYGKNDVSIENFSKYLEDNNIRCINIDAYTTYNSNGQKADKFTFIEPNKSYQENWSFYKQSIPKTVVYFLEMIVVVITLSIIIFSIIILIYYKALLYIIFGKSTDETSRADLGRSDARKLSQYAKPSIIILVAIILLLGSSFYWLGVRPSNIRKQCSSVSGRSATNTEYVDCLRRNGLKEDSLQSINDEQLKNLQEGIDEQSVKIDSLQKNNAKVQRDNANANTNTQSAIQSAIEKSDQESRERCQKELAEYNSCLSEYNAKLAEYNSCLSESSDPNSWRYNKYGSSCYKPSNYCFKPVCAY